MSYLTGITKIFFFYMLGICALIALYTIGLIALAMHTECRNSMQCFFLKLYLTTFQLQTLFMNLISYPSTIAKANVQQLVLGHFYEFK